MMNNQKSDFGVKCKFTVPDGTQEKDSWDHVVFSFEKGDPNKNEPPVHSEPCK